MISFLKNLKHNQFFNSIYIALVCFLTYSCIFAFRKPFTVALYSSMPNFMGVEFKNLLVISQVLGYTCSKIFGVKYISELKNVGRGKLLLTLIFCSLLPLFIFPLVPTPFNIFCLFLNGFPLGITWGVIFSFVEGRRGTDFIGAAMGASIIVSSGFAKSVAKWMQIGFNISDMWLPFYVGLVFVIPIIILIFLLEKIPAPTVSEVVLKTERLPMNNFERKKFFKLFMPGLLSFIFIYVVLTLFRDLRDNFAADIWTNLGYNNANVFTNTELPIAIIILFIIASMIVIKNNSLVFLISQYMIILGFLIALIFTILFTYHYLNGFNWMLLVGLGLYIAYTPFNSILFDRMIATFKLKGNVGFLIYLMDSFGYFASVIVIYIKGVAHLNLNWAQFYAKGVVIFSIIGLIISVYSLIYYKNKIKTFTNE